MTSTLTSHRVCIFSSSLMHLKALFVCWFAHLLFVFSHTLVLAFWATSALMDEKDAESSDTKACILIRELVLYIIFLTVLCVGTLHHLIIRFFHLLCYCNHQRQVESHITCHSYKLYLFVIWASYATGHFGFHVSHVWLYGAQNKNQ